MRLILTVFISYSCFILHSTNLFANTPAPQKTPPPSTTCSQSPPPLSKFITTIQKTLTQAQGPVLPTPCQPTLSAPPRTPPLKPGDSLKYNEPCGHEPKKQTLILIHGLNSSSETWTNTQNELCKNPDLRVITYDLRGHGESKAEGDDYSLDTMAGDLEALRNHLHLDSFHLIAHSYGARIALKYTKKFPSHVQSLILEDQDVFTRAETPGQTPEARFEEAKKIPNEFKDQTEAESKLRALYNEEMAKDFSQTKTKEIHPGTPGSQLKLNFNPYASERFAHQARSANLEKELSDADSDRPILFLESSDQSAIDHSRLVGFRAGNMLDFKIKTVPKSKHNIHKSNFPEFIKNVKEFYLQFHGK